MTTTNHSGAPQHRPLYRAEDDRMIAGVASGVAYWLDVDPIVVRVVLAVLTVFGGIGVVLYVIGWLLIPSARSASSVAEDWLSGRSRPGARAIAALIVAVVVVCIGLAHEGNALLLVAALAAVVVLVARARRDHGHRPPPGPVATGPTGPPAAGPTTSATGWPHAATAAATTAPPSATAPTAAPPPAAAPDAPAPDAPAPDAPTDPATDPDPDRPTEPLGAIYDPIAPPYETPRPPSSGAYRARRRTRRRSTSRLVLGAAALAGGAALLVDRAGAHLTSTQLIAIPLAVLGAGLLVGALVGRSWLAMAAAVPLTAAMLTSVAIGGNWDGGRHVTWQPLSVGALQTSYHLDSGEARLDLTRAGDLAGRSVRADVGAGRLVVIVPRGTPVRVFAHAGIGDLRLLGNEHSGINPKETQVDAAYTGPTGIDLGLRVGVGQVEVDRG